jgi:hypothetical protein
MVVEEKIVFAHQGLVVFRRVEQGGIAIQGWEAGIAGNEGLLAAPQPARGQALFEQEQ